MIRSTGFAFNQYLSPETFYRHSQIDIKDDIKSTGIAATLAGLPINQKGGQGANVLNARESRYQHDQYVVPLSTSS